MAMPLHPVRQEISVPAMHIPQLLRHFSPPHIQSVREPYIQSLLSFSHSRAFCISFPPVHLPKAVMPQLQFHSAQIPEVWPVCFCYPHQDFDFPVPPMLSYIRKALPSAVVSGTRPLRPHNHPASSYRLWALAVIDVRVVRTCPADILTAFLVGQY